MAPASRRMDTPAMLWDTGNSATVASLAEPAGPTQPFSLSISNLKLAMGARASLGAGAACARPVARAAAVRVRDAAEMESKSPRRLMPCFSSACFSSTCFSSDCFDRSDMVRIPPASKLKPAAIAIIHEKEMPGFVDHGQSKYETHP